MPQGKTSGLVLADPLRRRRRGPKRRHAIEHARRVGVADDERAMLGADETLFGRAIEEREQRTEVAADVEHGDRLLMQAELRPGDRLEELVERPEPARQPDEAVGELRHERLPLVHARNDPEVGEPLVRDLLRRERPRNDADHLAAGLQHRIGDDAHEPDTATAVDESDAAPGELARERRRRVGTHRSCAEARPTEHAHPPQTDHVAKLQRRAWNAQKMPKRERRRSRASLPAAKAKPSVSSRSEGEAERLFPQRRRSRASLPAAKAKPSVSSRSEGEAERLFPQRRRSRASLRSAARREEAGPRRRSSATPSTPGDRATQQMCPYRPPRSSGRRFVLPLQDVELVEPLAQPWRQKAEAL